MIGPREAIESLLWHLEERADLPNAGKDALRWWLRWLLERTP